ncbi:D-alanyl-D-alanine carboxypeptidase/D-alanyl-D-alanine-endopeptidase [Pedococcus sp. 5OH_020]|uniref:D-alanyl-D-alanine carboxypeptidase/D-alanyl-D-alanine-endopeptidase n=1 Tax=Pedococcus sp. 5OH_020 TaxID=2989814 RepID=UPI0022EA0C39|nr:D-alanyl-D-alanine carboxypeptidase [Pedococcus sp. 5OH_020]
MSNPPARVQAPRLPRRRLTFRPTRLSGERGRTRTVSRALVTGVAVGTMVAALAAVAPASASPAVSPAVTAAAAPRSAPASTTALATYTRTSADLRISSKLTGRVTITRFGTSFTGSVIDAASGAVVWSKNGSTGLMPASTAKWVTATDALAVFGATARFTTRVKRGYQADQVILVGSGDPSFSSAQLATLAKSTAAAMKARGQLRVRVYADDSLFPTPSLATGWKSTYIPNDTTWLRALVVDGRLVTDTTIDAANLFAGRLKANGLTVTRIGRGRATSTDPVLASSAGQTVSQIVSRMMLESDNEHAEALHRLVSLRMGYGATWTGARTAASKRLAAEGLTANALYDGSGLSRSDRLTGLQLSRMVTNIFETGNTTKLALLQSGAGLPTAGQTGTLKASYGRFTTAASKCAVGRVFAKTGTLSDAAALVGWTRGTDQRVKAFAFVVNAKSASLTLKQSLDMLAATVVGCY